MKILLFANQLLTSDIITGGDKKFVELGKRWKKMEHEVSIVLPSLAYRRIKKIVMPSKCYITGESLMDNYCLYTKHIFWIPFVYLIRTLEALSKFKYIRTEIIYTTGDFLCNTFPAFLMRVRNPKNLWVANIYHVIPPPMQRRGSFITNLTSFFMQRLSFQLIKWHADLIFVLNNVVKNQLIKLGFHKDRIYVTGAGINFTHINRIRQVKEVEYDACFLARLHEAKGIFDLIEIWKLVVSKKSAQLAVIYGGSKNLESALMKRIREENLEANVFMLPLTGDDALRVVKSSKIFVFPSHEEGWGIAICEAMACGLPVVAYDLPVYREIFAQGIVTVPLKDIKRFSEEVVNLLENDEKRHVLGDKGRSQVTMYDWDSVAARELSLMKNELVQE